MSNTVAASLDGSETQVSWPGPKIGSHLGAGICATSPNSLDDELSKWQLTAKMTVHCCGYY